MKQVRGETYAGIAPLVHDFNRHQSSPGTLSALIRGQKDGLRYKVKGVNTSLYLPGRPFFFFSRNKHYSNIAVRMLHVKTEEL